MIDNAYVKDLKRLGRDLKKIVLVDNSPVCYSLQPENGIPIKSWYGDKTDTELYKLTDFL